MESKIPTSAFCIRASSQAEVEATAYVVELMTAPTSIPNGRIIIDPFKIRSSKPCCFSQSATTAIYTHLIQRLHINVHTLVLPRGVLEKIERKTWKNIAWPALTKLVLHPSTLEKFLQGTTVKEVPRLRELVLLGESVFCWPFSSILSKIEKLTLDHVPPTSLDFTFPNVKFLEWTLSIPHRPLPGRDSRAMVDIENLPNLEHLVIRPPTKGASPRNPCDGILRIDVFTCPRLARLESCLDTVRLHAAYDVEGHSLGRLRTVSFAQVESLTSPIQSIGTLFQWCPNIKEIVLPKLIDYDVIRRVCFWSPSWEDKTNVVIRLPGLNEAELASFQAWKCEQQFVAGPVFTL